MRPPLARAIRAAGLGTTDVAARLGVDPKTVGRWLSGRTPYPRHRAALIHLTGWEADDLWPRLANSPAPNQAADDVLVAYPHRSAVPAEVWRGHFARAQHDIGILAYSALFLAEDTATQRLLRSKAQLGVKVRLALGDPAGHQVARRGAEEGIGNLMIARAQNALILLQPLAEEHGTELRLHDTVLYNSIYVADDDLLVNCHVYGAPASRAPVLHLRRHAAGGLAAHYRSSFEHVWREAHQP